MMRSVLNRIFPLSLTLAVVAAGCVMAQGGRGGGAVSPVAAALVQTAPAGAAAGGEDLKKYVNDTCTGCHGMDQITSAKHDLAGWTETVKKMTLYGVDIKDDKIPTVACYLAVTYPNGTPPTCGAPAGKTDEADAKGKHILETACTTCHDLGPVERRADDRTAWESVVYGMVGNGADVKDADIPVLVDYLVKFYGPPKDNKAAPAAPATQAPAGGRGGRGGRGGQ